MANSKKKKWTKPRMECENIIEVEAHMKACGKIDYAQPDWKPLDDNCNCSCELPITS